MSADNGIYILQSPVEGISDKFEYRVKDCSAVDSIDERFTKIIKDDDDTEYQMHLLYEVLIFGKCLKYETKLRAMEAASILEDAYHVNNIILEYGIRTIRSNHPFPNTDYKEAKRLIDKHFEN